MALALPQPAGVDFPAHTRRVNPVPQPAAVFSAARLAPWLLTLFLVLLLLPLISATTVPYFRDQTNYFLAMRWHLAATPALWLDAQYLGLPAYADPQYGFWHPQALLFRLLPFVPAYNLTLIAMYACIAAFAYALLARLAAPLTGLFFAIAICGNGAIISLSEFPSYLASFATLFPLACALARVHAGQSHWLYALPPLAWCAITAGGIAVAGINLLAAAIAVAWLVRRGRVTLRQALTVAALTIAFCWLPCFYFAELYVNSALALPDPVALDFRIEFSELLKVFTPWLNRWTDFSFANLFPFLYAGLVAAALFILGVRQHPRLALATFAAGALAVFGGDRLPLHLFRYPEKLFVYAVVLAAAVAAGAFHRLRWRPAAKGLLLALLALELLAVNRPYFLTMPLDELLAAGREIPLAPGERVMSLVSTDLMPRFTAASLPAYHREQFRYHYGLTAVFYGQSTFLGYSPAKLAAYQRLRDLHARPDLSAAQLSNLLRHCGVSAVIARTAIDGQPVVGAPDWQTVYRSPDGELQVFRLDRLLPLFMSETDFVRARWPEDALDRHAAASQPAATAADRYVLNCPGPGVMVLDKLDYPGWQTAIDGIPVGHARAFDAFIAVPVPPGQHRVSAQLTPTLLRLNLVILVIAALLVIRLAYRSLAACSGG